VHSTVGCTSILVWLGSVLLECLSQLCRCPMLWEVSQGSLATRQLVSQRMRSERQLWLRHLSCCPVPPRTPHVPAHHAPGQQHDCPVNASRGRPRHSRPVISHSEWEKSQLLVAVMIVVSNNNSNNSNNVDDDVSQQEGSSCSVGMTCPRGREP